MSNLLLEDDRKSIRRDYLIRLSATFLLLLFASAFIGAVLLLPSFFLVESQKRTLLQETALEKLEVSGEEPRAVIRNTERKIESLADIGSREKAGALLASLIEERPSGIRLTSITYVRGKDAGALIVSGVAVTRSTLINFSSALERNRRFTGVELPVSNLASNRNILFSLSFKVIP